MNTSNLRRVPMMLSTHLGCGSWCVVDKSKCIVQGSKPVEGHSIETNDSSFNGGFDITTNMIDIEIDNPNGLEPIDLDVESDNDDTIDISDDEGADDVSDADDE